MALLNASVLRLAMFLFTANIFCLTAHAWNSDYAYGLPRQKRMCISREAESVIFTSVADDEACPAGSRRYIVVFGKEPRGSMAMIPIVTSDRFYPPLIIKWPGKEETTNDHLWHFTCIEPMEIPVLDSTIQLKRYKGEITAKAEKDCLEVQERALKYCQEEYQGMELLESCPLSWGGR